MGFPPAGDLLTFPLGSLRALIVRATSALPALPGDLVDPTTVRPHYAACLEMLVDIAAHHSSDLASYAGERIGSATDPSHQDQRRNAVNQSYLRRLRQRLGLRLFEHGARVPWLEQAIGEADREIAVSPGGYEHLDVLATQVNAHARAGDLSAARQLLARVIPESFIPQLARAVDIRVLPAARSEWRRTLELAPTPASTRDADDTAADDARQPEDYDDRWGESEFGLFKSADGSTTKPDAVLESSTNLDDALAWRSAQAEAAIGESDLTAWSRNHADGVRRQAWYLLTAQGQESVRTEALRDLVDLLVSADYWPGMLTLELREILPVVAPGLPPATIWHQAHGHLHQIRAGLAEPNPPGLGGPVHAGWWAGPAEAPPSAPVSTVQRKTAEGQPAVNRLDVSSVGAALTDLVLIHLDHPLWAVREGAAAVLAWLLAHGRSLAAGADAQVSAILASTSDYPALTAALRPTAAEAPSVAGGPRRVQGATTARAPEDGEGLGGEGHGKWRRARSRLRPSTHGRPSRRWLQRRHRPPGWHPSAFVRYVPASCPL